MFVYEVEFASVIRGHQVYKVAWKDDRKEAKEHDEYTVGTYLEVVNKRFGRVPMVLPGSFLARTTSRAIATKCELKEIIRLKELCTHMGI